MKKIENSSLILSHDHLVQAVAEYLSNHRIFWPLPENSEIVDIDFGMPLDEDGERYTLDVTFEIDTELE